jgi:hypothetical protein
MLGILWCKPQLGSARQSSARQVAVRWGQLRQQLQTAALRAQALSAALFESGYDAARHCWAWYCVVRKGVAGLQLQTAAQGISVPSAALFGE